MTVTKPDTQFIAEPGAHDFTIVAVQDAPREAVFRAYTEPELIKRWWGPAELTTTIDELDLRPGGVWRFVQTDPEGNEHGFRGVIHAVVPGELIIQTFEWEGMPNHVSLQTLRLEDAESGGTKITAHAVFQTVEDRDGMADTGAREFAPEGMARMAEALQTR